MQRAVGLLIGAWFALASQTASADPDARVVRGEYLMRAGDCIACHTEKGGQPFAGGLGMTTPVGVIYTPNITPDKATGIGEWSDDAFYRALHDGIGRHGEYLYPAFPFPWYTNVTREDALDIKAYLFSLAPVTAPPKGTKLAFPFNVRESLLAWRIAFFKTGTFKPDPAVSPEINRGAYLVKGLGHCGECHNSNNLFGASDWSGRLQGGMIEDWYAPNLTSNAHEGIGGWSSDELAQYLKTGFAPDKSVALGPMMETIHDSLSHLSDADLHAIAAYLKSVPAKASYADREPVANSAVIVGAEATYNSFCGSCHQANGLGMAGVVPPLAGNGAVKSKGPENVIRVVLGGLPAQHGLAPMPAVGVGMTDQQVADATNYVRQAWGNAAPAKVGPGEVGRLRGETKTLLAANLGECPKVEDPALAAAVDVADISGPLAKVNSANMLEQIDALLPRLKAAAPSASADDLVNALTVAYCPVAFRDTTIPKAERGIQIGTFSELVYGQMRPKT